MSRPKKIWISKLLDYARSIDRSWLITWSLIFISFIVLDSFFQTHFSGQDIFYDMNLFGKDLHFEVVKNGTFIGVTIIKYAGIVLSFIYAKVKFKRDYILQIALLFTLLADTILTLDSISELGVLAFCLAQYFHNARFAGMKPYAFIAWSVFLLLILMFGHFHHINNMYSLAIIYGTSLIANIILTYRWWRKSKKPWNKATDREIIASTCAFFGFILFILCDINVGISYLSVTGVLPLKLATFANFFAWMFYYPSQVLISNSSPLDGKVKRKVEKL
ncbi:hypothetical protein IJI76_00455 [Candidatus Saccharibacteria bacterium]|nr:hypothetical protein [Candidatus Saccharibacteria bacterium]